MSSQTRKYPNTDCYRLEKAYEGAGIADVEVNEISSGRYEVIKPRGRQIITHRELNDEIARLERIGSYEGPDPMRGVEFPFADNH